MRVFKLLPASFVLLLACAEPDHVYKRGSALLEQAACSDDETQASACMQMRAYDPLAAVATNLTIPAGDLQGAAVEMPVGALTVATNVFVEESVRLNETSVGNALYGDDEVLIRKAGSGLVIRPADPVDLYRPLSIVLQLRGQKTVGADSGAGDEASLNLTESTHYAVFFTALVNGVLKSGVLPESSLQIRDGQSVAFEGGFGAYWLAEVNTPVTDKVEAQAPEPIVNRGRVAVITDAGVVKDPEVVNKGKLPRPSWSSVTLSFDASRRALTVKAALAEDIPLHACKADLFRSKRAASGIRVPSGSALEAERVIHSSQAMRFFARFRCFDADNRLLVSPWSSPVRIPEVPAP